MLKRLGFVFLTPLLLWLGWPEGGFTPFLFIAFIPLLLLEKDLTDHGGRRIGRKWFWYSYLSFMIWNLLGNWWIVYASWTGVVGTMLLNGFLMAIVMVLFRFIKNKLGNQRGYISIPFLWICFETLHKDWDLSFPWLNLGNGFADRVEWVQWYEHVGAFGGTFWVWTINLFFFWIITAYLKHREIKPLIGQSITLIVLGILAPISLSYWRYYTYQEQGEKATVISVQPNFNAYTEKFEFTEAEQLSKFLDLAEPLLNDSVDFLVGPETMLPDGIWESQIEYAPSIVRLKALVKRYPRLNIIMGANTMRYYREGNQPDIARPLKQGGYYTIYNTGLLINQADSVQIYHKSKLVLGVEMMPFSRILKPLLGEMVQDFGGISGTNGTQYYREVFPSYNQKFKVAPIICWESDFGEYTSKFVQNGANLIFVVTNDDWWGNTPGHIRHMHFSRIRAIENRRSVARSANTGISCFINQRGDVFQPKPYRTDAAIKQTIQANTELTYYSKVGDLFSRLSLFIGGFLLLFSFVRGFLNKRQVKS